MNPGPKILARCMAGLAGAVALGVWAPLLLANPQLISADGDPVWKIDRRVEDSPAVRVTCPEPSPLLVPIAPPSIRITWEGSPASHHGYSRIREYKYILLGPGSEFPVALAVVNPDSLRRYYADHPLGPWTGWTSTSPTVTEAEFDDLIPNEPYLFAVIAFDRAGRYTQAFTLSTNMLRFNVGFAGYQGPVLTMTGPGLNYTYPHGGYCACAAAEIPESVPAQSQATFQWSGAPGFACGSPAIRSYRWALDIADVFDETPRTDESTDLEHWSARSLDATSATVGPFGAGEIHRLYIDVEDRAGVRSLGIIRIEVPAGERQTLDVETEAPGVVSMSSGTIVGDRAELSYTLPSPADVSIATYDISGRRVATIENASRGAGTHRVTWDPSRLRHGVYFYRLRAGSVTVTRSFVLVR
jgi:hypothetical protein